MAGTLWTIGHSNRTADEFTSLLVEASIGLVADVRRFPGSLKHPQFRGETLAEDLARDGIGYRHLPGLGGRRGKPALGSPNTGWRVASFAAYADYMNTEAFLDEIAALIGLAGSCRVATMCSEAVPWRCHRRLIADAMLVRGWSVRDIIGPGQIRDHELTPFARLVDGRLVYPGS